MRNAYETLFAIPVERDNMEDLRVNGKMKAGNFLTS